MENNIDLSVVIPAYNEEKNLPVLVERLGTVLKNVTENFEILVVNDGSEDATATVLEDLAKTNARLKAVNLSRNFGHQAALNAGLELCSGAAAITMDADLQHPPEKVPEMYREFKQGFDLVLGERKDGEKIGYLKYVSSRLFYYIMNRFSDVDIRANVADFNLYSRRVIEVLRNLPEKDRFLRGLVQWVGFPKTYVEYTVAERLSGKSKYSLKKMISLAVSGITSFSSFPMRIAWWLGLSVSSLGFIYALYIVFSYFFNPSRIINGWTSSIIAVLILGGTQLLILGIMGEYISKIFSEIKGRPAYLVRSTVGFKRDEK